MKTETIEKFFAGKRFVIPDYQRDYVWGKENIDELLSDIGKAIYTRSHHYLGMFILTKGCVEQQYKIVDGQQRLITITMLLAALIDKLEDADRKLHETSLFIGQQEDMKLELLGKNREFFIELLANVDPVPSSKSQHRLQDGYAHLRALVKGKSQGALGRWLDCIRQIEILEYIELDEGNAIRLFQSANDKGVSLSNKDKVKSLLHYYANRISDGDQDESVNNKFLSVLEEI